MYIRNCRKTLASILIVLLLFVSATNFALAATPQDYEKTSPEKLETGNLYSTSSVLIDADTCEILFSKDSHVRMYPASMTKIMTLLLAVESGVSFDTVVSIPAEVANVPKGSSLIPIFAGETTTFGDLLYGLMLHSGNDGAIALAVLLAGNNDKFVERMNNRAAEIGCEGTHFTNSHGYHDDNHYSTAYDIALIMREAIKHPEVREILAATKYTMHVKERGDIPLATKNSIMTPTSKYYFADCIGGKTGTTSKAGYCFAGVTEKDGVSLISVVMNTPEDDEKWVDTIRLFNYGYTCYTPYSLEEMYAKVGSEITTVKISNAREDDPQNGILDMRIAQVSNPEYVRMVRTDSAESLQKAVTDFISRSTISITAEKLAAPITAGEIIGNFSYRAQDGENVTALLIADRSIEEQPEKKNIEDVFPFFRIFNNPIFKALLVVLLLLIILIAAYAWALNRQRERQRRELFERRRREYQLREAEAYETRRRAPPQKRSARAPQTRSSAQKRQPTRKSAAARRSATPQKRPTSKRNDSMFGDF